MEPKNARPSLTTVRASIDERLSEVERLEELTRKLSRIVRYRTQTYADGTEFVDLEQSTE